MSPLWAGKVGPTWGRKMTRGFLSSSSGIHVAERRVGSSLARVAPAYHDQRQDRTEQLTNPIPYSAEYFGHKLHIDQNEKLVMYGVVHVCAIDGYSGKIVSHALMAVKNNLLIYEHIYRRAVQTYGMWDQLRVDHGREFCLMLAIQDSLSEKRRNTNRLPYLQTTSKRNHRIERIWVEINTRVNYPIKKALNSMVNSDILDMEDGITKFSVSWVTLRVCHAGCGLVIESWNAHSVPGKGVPNEMQAANNMTVKVPPELLPTTSEAVELYEQQGGHLTVWPEFGKDPLSSEVHLSSARLKQFQSHFPEFATMFHGVVNKNPTMFQNAILLFRDLTFEYCSNM
ncbi:hypothetical protein ACROYT_G028964 [Oculina patagonica]